jgi:penicillin amidase
MFYAWGTVLAEDRLFQMAFKLLVLQGRLAEHVGERAVNLDKYMRELNLLKWGKKMAERI